MATKTKLKKPTVSITRSGYKFSLSFSNIDNDAEHIWIEKEVWEKQDSSKTSAKQREYKKIRIGAKGNSSWSFTLDKNKYYPFVADGTDSKPKESDLKQRISKIICRVWVTGKITNEKKVKKDGKTTTKKTSTNGSSEKVTKTYKFDKAKDPKVDISYDEDGTSFVYAVDINDDYRIDDSYKKVATRAWVWLTKDTKGDGKKAVKVSGHTGKWYNNDVSKQVRKKIATTISPTTPVKYTVHAYAAGPGGKYSVKTKSHVFARPLNPKEPKIKRANLLKNSSVDNSFGFYNVEWSINTDNGWRPVDNVTIQYRDQKQYKGASDIYGENMGSWSTAKGNIKSAIKKIQTDELGAVADDSVRYFRILVEHDGNKVPSYVTGVVDYGKPSNVGSPTVTTSTVNGRQALVFSWSTPSTQLYGDKETKLYNGKTLGEGGRARILIFKNTTASKGLIKTIKYGSTEWKNNKWTYVLPKDEIGKTMNFCFQVRVGLDNLNPGGKSDNLWVYSTSVPEKCTNVVGTKQTNNTVVEVTWDNPETTDTISNGVEVAWSTMPNAWESNSQPSTVQFENGAMTKAYITGLTSGEVYYFWVRRYETSNGNTNYSLWSDPSEGVLMSDEPDIPILTTSRTWIKEGGNLSAQWIYSASGNLPQTSAKIEISTDKRKWIAIASVDGEEDKCTLDLSETITGTSSAQFTDDEYVEGSDSNISKKYKYPAGDYYARVVVSNSMGNACSDPTELTIATNPTCTLSSTSIADYSYGSVVDDANYETTTVKALREMPLTVNVTGEGDLDLYIYSIDDFEWEHPDRTETIFSGDCVWTSSVEEGTYVIESANLADNCWYRLQLECTDPDTLLKSEPQYIDFKVMWSHQAVEPTGSSVLINDGVASLTPSKPSGASNSDVCDIYRTTADGRYLCRKDVAWGQVVTDILPTFGDINNTSYCFCTRTQDGDEAFTEIDYELEGSGIIVTYGNKSIALPWNVAIDDNRTKQGEIRSHLGGTKLYFSQPYIDRKQSLTTEVVKVDNEDLINELYELSRYTGLCYIRASNNIGYPATIDVSINREYNNQIVSVSLSATEADANGEYLGSIN